VSVHSGRFVVSCVPLSGWDLVVRVPIRLGCACMWMCCLCEFGHEAVGFCLVFS
jgi:hypothetical protein